MTAQHPPPQPATVSTPSDREIRMERVFNAERDRVWRAMTTASLVSQWWGRGNPLTIERFEVRRGGHWRFVEHTPEGNQGFEGRFREVVPPERVVQTFEWDGMPGHVVVDTMTLEDLGDGRTRLVSVSQFLTNEERDGMLHSGMAEGANQSYQALDRLLEKDDAAALDAAAPARAGRGVRKVAFTMYPVKDVARARAFYEETLGLAVGMAGGREGVFWVEYDLPGGGCFAITNATQDAPSDAAGGTIALEVEDLPTLMTHLRAQGVTFKGDVVKGPRCRMIVCLDTEGNSLLLHQLDRPAA